MTFAGAPTHVQAQEGEVTSVGVPPVGHCLAVHWVVALQLFAATSLRMDCKPAAEAGLLWLVCARTGLHSRRLTTAVRRTCFNILASPWRSASAPLGRTAAAAAKLRRWRLNLK